MRSAKSALGEALVAAANGVVSDEALTAFQKAVAADPHEPKANYFLGLADEQAGRREAAVAKWRALLDSAPPDAPWAGFVRDGFGAHHHAPDARGRANPAERPIKAQHAAKGPSAPMLASGNRGAAHRTWFAAWCSGSPIACMATAATVDEWLRLVQAYVVLGDRDKAKGAAADAKRALSDHPDEIKRIDDLTKVTRFERLMEG